MSKDNGRNGFVSVRPTPGYIPRKQRTQGSEVSEVLRLHPRMNADAHGNCDLRTTTQRQNFGFFQAQRISMHPVSLSMQPQKLQCFDGFSTVLEGKKNVFLTGSGSGCEMMLSTLLLHALADNGSVLLLTGDQGANYGSNAVAHRVCNRYGLSLHTVGDADSGRFLPFANWTQQQIYGYFSQKVASEYMGHNATPDADMLGCIVDLFELMEANHRFVESLVDPRFSYQMALEHCEQAAMPEENRNKLYNHIINHTSTLMKAQGILREFIMAFRAMEQNCNGEGYSIFSPGVNRVIIDAQNAVTRGSLPWFLLQMIGYLNSLASADQKITVLVDGLVPNALQKVMSLLHNSNIRTIVVASSVMELGDQTVYTSILGRCDQVFIFRQQDRNAAEFWASLSGDRKVLLRNYSTGNSTSSQMWQFQTRGTSQGNGYTETFRPNVQAGDFAAMDDRKAYLYMVSNMSSQSFHPFSLD